MKKKILFRNKELIYNTSGKAENTAVVFLHGYLENSSIWTDFIKLLEQDYYIICPDIPGHGESEHFAECHDMDTLAEAIDLIVREEKLSKFHLTGHSMGGYLALAYLHAFEKKLYSCTLFHSTIYADTEEKKNNRDREIQLIREGKKELIINSNIPKAFADDNLNTFSKLIEQAKETGLSNQNQGIISLLEGMKSRPERSRVIKNSKVPILVIGGEKDNYIPIDVLKNMVNSGTNIELSVLKNSGHMGFMEEKQTSANILTNFFKRTTV